MKQNERIDFIKMTEKLVTPEKVAKLFQNAEMLRKLPRFLQKKIMEKGSKNSPFISFIVEPYSFFLAYEIIDEEKISQFLPEDYELVKTSMFEGNKERNSVIIGVFDVHTSVFWGNRLEVYIIARNKKTNMVSWIIYEYETNTISYDPGRGFIPPGTVHSVHTTSFLGEIIIDVLGKDCKNKLKVNANINKDNFKALNQTLWIEGNFSVDYGNELNEVNTKPFGLIFDPEEMKEALNISIEDCDLIENNFLEGIIAEKPFEVCCFPYAQHFYTTTIPTENNMKNKDDLENKILEINEEAAKKSNCLGYCYSYSCKNGCNLPPL